MAKSGVHGTGIDEECEPQLLDMALALEVGVGYDIKDDIVVDGEESTIDGVVDDLALVGHFGNI